MEEIPFAGFGFPSETLAQKVGPDPPGSSNSGKCHGNSARLVHFYVGRAPTVFSSIWILKQGLGLDSGRAEPGACFWIRGSGSQDRRDITSCGAIEVLDFLDDLRTQRCLLRRSVLRIMLPKRLINYRSRVKSNL